MPFAATLRPLARSPVLCIAVVLTLALGAVAQTAACVCTFQNDKGTGRCVSAGYHTTHDCRRTFAYLALTYEGGDERRDSQWAADNLGHGDTVMGGRIYGKYRIGERHATKAAGKAATVPHPTDPTGTR